MDSVMMHATKHVAWMAETPLACILTLGGYVGKTRGNGTRVISTCEVSFRALTA